MSREDLQKNNTAVRFQILLLGPAKKLWAFLGFWQYNYSLHWEALATKNRNPNWNQHNQ